MGHIASFNKANLVFLSQAALVNLTMALSRLSPFMILSYMILSILFFFRQVTNVCAGRRGRQHAPLVARTARSAVAQIVQSPMPSSLSETGCHAESDQDADELWLSPDDLVRAAASVASSQACWSRSRSANFSGEKTGSFPARRCSS